MKHVKIIFDNNTDYDTIGRTHIMMINRTITDSNEINSI